MTPEDLAMFRGRLVAHEAMIMAIAIELAGSEKTALAITETAKLLFDSMPKGSGAEVRAAIAQGERYLDIMTKMIRSV